MTYHEWLRLRHRYYHWLAMCFHGNATPAGFRNIGWTDSSARHFARQIRKSAAKCLRDERAAAPVMGGAK